MNQLKGGGEFRALHSYSESGLVVTQEYAHLKTAHGRTHKAFYVLWHVWILSVLVGLLLALAGCCGPHFQEQPQLDVALKVSAWPSWP